MAHQRREEERRRLAQEAERRRLAELEALVERETQVWRELEALIPQTTGSAYRQAVELLAKLRDLANHRGREVASEQRLSDVCVRHSGRKAGLQGS